MRTMLKPHEIPNYDRPENVARRAAEAAEQEESAAEKRARWRRQLNAMIAQESARNGAVRHLAAAARVLVDVGDHVPELLAAREAVTAALQPFEDR